MKQRQVSRENGFPVGIRGSYKARVGSIDYADDYITVFIRKYDPNGVSGPESLVFDKKSGNVKFVKCDTTYIQEYLFRISAMDDSDAIMVALAEALYDSGYYPEVDNRERITAQALAEERKESIEYLRKQQEKIVDKLLE